MFGAGREGEPIVDVVLWHPQELEGEVTAVGSQQGIPLAQTLHLALHFLDLRLLDEPLVEFVGLLDHGVETGEYALVGLLLVAVVLVEEVQQRSVLLLLVLQDDLLQFAVEDVLLEEELLLQGTV